MLPVPSDHLERLYALRLREGWGRALTLVFAIIFLIIGLAIALMARNQTGELVGSGLSLLGILLCILAVYSSRTRPGENDSETIAEKYRI